MSDNPYPICAKCIFADEPIDKDPCQACIRAFLAQSIKPNFVSKRKPKTNADRIRAMSDEELAAWIDDVTDCKGTDCPVSAAGLCNGVCTECWLKWLKQEMVE